MTIKKGPALLPQISRSLRHLLIQIKKKEDIPSCIVFYGFMVLWFYGLLIFGRCYCILPSISHIVDSNRYNRVVKTTVRYVIYI
jgi:hypothetical protein